MNDINERIKEFVVNKNDKTYREIESYLYNACKSLLWKLYKSQDKYLIDEAFSHVSIELLKTKVVGINFKGLVFSIIEKFYFKSFRRSVVELTEDIPCPDNENELNDLKIETVVRLKQALKESTHVNALLVVTALIQLIMNEQDYDFRFATLYLRRTTKLSGRQIRRVYKALNIELSICRDTAIENMFRRYFSKYGCQSSTGLLIEEWERNALIEFADSNQKGVAYDLKRHAITNKQKASTATERKNRIDWINSNTDLEGERMLVEYIKKFNRSDSAFYEDKRKAKSLLESI